MLKRVLLALGMMLIVALILLLVFPIVFKKQISEGVKTGINKSVNAHVDYTGLSFSLLSHFPNPAISLDNFVIVGEDEFEGDTLAAVQHFNFTIDLKGLLWRKRYKILAINIINPIVKLQVNKGKANWDIMKSTLAVTDKNAGTYSDTGSSSNLSFEVNHLKLENGVVEFRNDSAHTYLLATGCNINGNQAKGKDSGYFETTTGISELTCNAAGITCLSKTKFNAVIKNSFNPSTGRYNFSATPVSLNDLHLRAEGSVTNAGAGQTMNVSIQSTDTAFKSLLSVVPSLYDSSYGQLKSAGTFSLSGNIKGMHQGDIYPAFSFSLKVANGMLQKKNFPEPVKNILADVEVEKPEGVMDSTVIQVSNLRLATGNDSINAALLITTPASNAKIKADVKGSIELSSLAEFYTIDDVKQLTGLLSADLHFNGHKNDIDHKNYKLVQASGKIGASHISFQKNNWPQALQINDADFTVMPDFISMNNLTGHFGTCNFKGSGKFENVIAYLTQQGTLLADLGLNADVVNIEELINQQTPVKVSNKGNSQGGADAATGKKSVSDNDINLVIHTTVDKIYAGKFVLSNLQAVVESKRNTLNANVTNAGLFGGKVSGNAGMNNINEKPAAMTFKMKAINVDIAKVRMAIDSDGKVAPGLQYLNGPFSGDISGNAKVKIDQCSKFESITMDGNLNYPDLRIDEMPVLVEIGKLAKVKSLDHLEAKNVQSSFHYKNNNATIDPTDVKFTNGYKLNFKGTNYANQTVDADIALDVPVKEFGSIASLAQNLLSGFMSVPQNVHFAFKVTGKNTNPQVKVVNVGTSGN